jgi:DNA-binding transcriptional LysR family regulator
MVVRAGHPLTQGEVTVERLFAFPHIVVELTGTEEQAVDGFMDDRGVERRVWIERFLIEMGDDAGVVGRVGVSVPHYFAVPPILHVTDMVATLPRRLALQAVEGRRLVILDLPFQPREVTVEAIWHQRANDDPGVQWLRGELIEAMKQADAI